MPPGPTGAGGLPGSTTTAPTTAYPQSTDAAKLPRRRGGPPVRGAYAQQQAVRPDQNPYPNAERIVSPRATPRLATPRSGIVTDMQTNSPQEFYGGLPLKTGPGNHIQGGEPGRPAAAEGGRNVRDTTTPWAEAQPQIGRNVPGAANVRNQVAQRYKNRPGDMHTYQSASRPDNRVTAMSWDQAKGVAPWETASGVTVPSRFVFAGGGNQTWAVLRRMPYTGRGDGARGAQLNGQRYYGVGGYDNFRNAGQGGYGQPRLSHKTPVSFAEPAPWSANIYTTTASVGSPGTSGANEQSPDAVFIAPGNSRAPNTARRRG